MADPTEANIVRPKFDRFAIVPRVVLARVETPQELTLWVIVRDIAGENGVCHLTTADLALLGNMSTGAVSAARKSLLDKALLDGSFYRDAGFPQPVWHLGIPNLETQNVEFCFQYQLVKERIALKRAQRESLQNMKASKYEEGVPLGEEGIPPGETKKILKEDFKTKENNDSEKILEMIKRQLEADMPRANFAKYVESLRLIDLGETDLCLGCPDAFVREWCESRLQSTISRMLVGMLNRSVNVQFFVAAETSGESA
jgi:hypothetical protein